MSHQVVYVPAGRSNVWSAAVAPFALLTREAEEPGTSEKSESQRTDDEAAGPDATTTPTSITSRARAEVMTIMDLFMIFSHVLYH